MKASTLQHCFYTAFIVLIISFFVQGCMQKKTVLIPNQEGKKDMYDGPGARAQFEFDRIKDPATGSIPAGKYWQAVEQTRLSKSAGNFGSSPASSFGSGWVERGPNSDFAGPSNGNTRANSGIPSGRVRAVLVDAADATNKTVWIGGVAGGLWKTTDVTVSSPVWTPVNDYMINLAIADIAQQPGNPNIMYFCTGEGYFNIDAVAGSGVFKSTNNGVTWAQLPSTAGWTANRVLVDAAGNVYVGTAQAGAFGATGIQRSTDGGTTWTNITPSGSSSRIADMELSSTGRLHITTGLGTSTIGMYRYASSPSTVTSATWTAPATGFPYPSGANCRVELGCNGNILYALPSNTSAEVATIYKSTDGGANWAATGSQPTAGWASGQAWYNLAVGIDPSDPTNGCIVGALDTWKTTNGGASWSQISTWVGTTPVNQYVHADVHKVVWFDNGNKLIFASDGGIFYSSDKGATIRDRNVGLRIKQFYSCAIHPSTTNYFIGGTQDNGNHKFTNAGLSSTEEFIGGDGAYTAIDQDQSQYQFAAYVFNIYRRSTNGGATWSTVNWSGSAGQFINPWDYDNTGNRIYGCWSAGQYFRWDDPQTGVTASAVTVPAFNSALVSAVHVSPYTANQVYFGTAGGRVVRVTSAESASPTATNITGASMPAGAYLSCVNTGTDDNNLIACFSNYGVASVWVSSNGGASWTSLDNNGVNLPDMPVRWCMFYPGDNTRAILATETGIWETDLINGTSTVWVANTGFPTVRTDMLEYRSSDGTLAAATHGRGLWTNTINDKRTADFRTKATGSYSDAANWEFNTYGSVYMDARSIPSANNNAQVQTGHVVTLDGNHVVNTGKTFTVNGTLNCGTNTISGTGSFVSAAASTLGIGSTDGITASGATGNIQTTTRSFSTTGNYTYNGAFSQSAGNGLPANINNLVIANTGGALNNIVSLGSSAAVNGSTALTSGILSIGSNTLTLNGAVTGSGTFSGTASGGVSTSSLVIGGAAGTLNFTQTSAATRSLNNLTLNSGSSATLGNALDVFGTITLTTATLNLNAQNLTLKSNTNNTARIGNLTGSTLTGATNVTVERWIKLRLGGSGRAYRLLAPTVNTTGSINANWMEGGMNTAIGTNVNPVPLFGTQITGAGGNANGFDKTQTNQSSFYSVTNAVTPTYTAIGNTGSTLNALTGYFLYLRGDRSMDMQIPLAVGMPTSSTTLRTTGTLLTGTLTSFTNPFIGGAGALNLVTNPYPSPIDWALVQPACTNVATAYTFWDPNFGTRGGFVTVNTAGVASSGQGTRFIQSGQAFFVQSTGGVPTVSIQEGHKSAGNNNEVFIVPPPPVESFRTELYFTEPNGYRRIADGAIALFNNSYSPGIDENDASEINNWDENIAIVKAGKHLAIESRPVIFKTDSLLLFMNNMKQQEYEFEFTPSVFTNPGMKAELIDNFTGSRTPLSLTGPSVVKFKVTANPASAAANRFKVLFNAVEAVPAPTGTDKSITIYPNPVTNHIIGLKFNSVEKGNYHLRLVDGNGRLVQAREVYHPGGNSVFNLPVNRAVSGGRYTLEILMPDNKKLQKALVIL
ncbi:MAG: hypothetical protein JNM14_12540 [Ferruginibacter sp.]|nr:hypothetical protein [Ferruginibacter sp.]